jgi:hypothetical protein
MVIDNCDRWRVWASGAGPGMAIWNDSIGAHATEFWTENGSDPYRSLWISQTKPFEAVFVVCRCCGFAIRGSQLLVLRCSIKPAASDAISKKVAANLQA